MRVLSAANIIAILNKALGEAASVALVGAFGGQRIDIPKTTTGRLVDILGPDITAVLVEHFGGCRLDVPSRGHTERVLNSLRLRQDILTSGLSANQIALKHGVTSTWVRRLRADICEAQTLNS